MIGLRPHANRSRVAGRRWLPAALAMVAAVVLIACEPADEPLPDPGEEPVGGAEGDVDTLGAPDDGVPGDLDALTERTDPEASRWQPDPRPSEVAVSLSEEGDRWASVAVTYVAGEADSLFVVRIDRQGLSTERVNFEPLGLEPVPAAALADIPDLDAALAVGDLAVAGEEEFSACDASAPAGQVRLATGAPASWQGRGWAQPPMWEAVVTDADGRGVRLDATSGEPADARCVDVRGAVGE